MMKSRRPNRRACSFLFLILALILGCDDDDPTQTARPISFSQPDPVCSLNNVDCTAEAEIAFRVRSDFTEDELEFELGLDVSSDGTVDEVLDVGLALGGTHPEYIATLTAPLGMHRLEISMLDGDGMTHEASIPFEVLDCKAPTPICINGLAVELQQQPPGTDADGDGDLDAAAMTVYASDFVASVVLDCSPPVVYSINRVGQTPDIAQTSLILTCDDIGTVNVEIHGWDSGMNPDGEANQDFCVSYILVQDSLGRCNN